MLELNLIIPAAGNGQRFVDCGYKEPKPFLPLNGKKMIECVIENIKPTNIKTNVILLVRAEHIDQYKDVFEKMPYDVQLVPVVKTTEGAACTILLARKFVKNIDSQPLLIANSDQLVDYDADLFVKKNILNHTASIITMQATESKWSFVGRDENGKINRVVEKSPISSEATVGIYFFPEGRQFINGAVDMIARNKRVNNEFYVAPVFNELIQDNLSVDTWASTGFFGLGTPEDYERYLVPCV